MKIDFIKYGRRQALITSKGESQISIRRTIAGVNWKVNDHPLRGILLAKY